MQPGAVLYTQGFGSRPESVEVPFVTNRAPTTLDTMAGAFPIGKFWVNTTTGNVYCLGGYSTALGVLSANWAFLGSTAGDLDTLTGDSGGAIGPTAGNINVLGTANQITTTGAGSTITWSLPTTLIAPGSLEVTSGFTVDAGTSSLTGTVNINTTGAGVTSIGSTSSGATNLKSGGTLTIDTAAAQNITVGPTQTSGTMNIGGTGANTGAVTLFGGTGAQTISLGASTGGKTAHLFDGAGANTVTLGSVNTTSATTVQSGSGALNITSTNGAMTLASGTGEIDISADATATTVKLATGAGAKALTVGSTTTTSSTAIQSGTGGISLASGATAGNVAITPSLNSAAGASITVNGRVGQATLTGLTTVAGTTETITITNSSISGTTQAILVSVDNLGTNDAQMTIQRVKQAASTLTVILKNNGAADLNGDLHVTFWILN